MATVTLYVRHAWWVRHYITALNIMHQITGMQPNWGRVSYWAGKAIKPECRPVDG